MLGGVSGLHLVSGNRMEVLSVHLAHGLREPLSDPFAAEQVVVQSLGMARWLREELARWNGICAQVEFPFPRAWILNMMGRILPEAVPDRWVSRDHLIWRIYHRLDQMRGARGFESVAWYLTGSEGERKGNDAVRRFQLARRIADLFDQYVVFRPEWIEAWESGREDHWQAELWRSMGSDVCGAHLGRWSQEAMKRLRDPDFPVENLPERVSVFGISALPPLYVEWLSAVAARVPVTVYLMQPCREYWGEIRSGKEILGWLERADQDPGAAEEFHLERGHRLLAMLGRQGRDFLRVLSEFDTQPQEMFVDVQEPEPPERRRSQESKDSSLLEVLQQDILELRDRTKGVGAADDNEFAGKVRWDAGDDSIRVHSCHGPLRELEVLRNTLLGWFEADSSLRPRDVLVMAPDIEVYASLIHGVFGSVENAPDAIPYTVADRTPALRGPVVDGLVRLLSWVGRPVTATHVYGLLENPLIQKRFGMESTDVPRMREWVIEAGIRWGLDASDRVRMGLPGLAQTTWRHGLDRLLLGYAMAPGDVFVVDDLASLDLVEGESAERVGCLAEMLSFLGKALADLAVPRTPSEWGEALLDPLEDLFGKEESARGELEQIRQLMERLDDELNQLPMDGNSDDAGDVAVDERMETEGGAEIRTDDIWGGHGVGNEQLELRFGADKEPTIPRASAAQPRQRRTQQAVPLEVIREQLEMWLNEDRHGQGFLGGGVTFCAMKPMRSIPARVVCLLGLNDGAFPRRASTLSFDLIAQDPRLGDSSREHDDRHLFLESMLSAREKLHLSHVGQSVRDNARIPPSVVVSELLDYLVDVVDADEKELRSQLCVVHRMQAFHPVYGGNDPRWRSYDAFESDSECTGVGASDATAFGDCRLTEVNVGTHAKEDAGEVVSMESLKGLLANPSRYFVRERLGIALRESDKPLEDDETFAMDNLQRHRLGVELLDAHFKKEDFHKRLDSWAGSGALPLGAPGVIARDEADLRTTAFLRRLKGYRDSDRIQPVDVRIDLGERGVLTGRLTRLTKEGLFHFRAGKLRPIDRLDLWLEHLVDCSRKKGDDELADGRVSLLVTEDAAIQFQWMESERARVLLGDLMRLRRAGWSKALPFFPNTSFAYMKACASAAKKGGGGPVEVVDEPMSAQVRKQVEDEWYGNPIAFSKGDANDRFVQLCFGHRDPDPLDLEFQRMSVEVLAPMMEWIVDLK